MNQVKKYKLSVMKAIKLNEYSYNELNNLQQALYQFYNTNQNRLINFQLLNKISLYQQAEQFLFSKVESIKVINKCYSLSTLGFN